MHNHPPEDSWATRPLGELIDHILAVHHEPERGELVRLQESSRAIAKEYGIRHPETLEVHAMIGSLAAELEAHMLREEMVLFPYIRELEAAERVSMPGFGTVAHPIRVMMRDHDVVFGILGRIREISRDFTVPNDGDPIYHALYGALDAFERDVRRHVRLENESLFPRAVRLEAKRASEDPEP
jgi:regulator of cell morphogenesis and NO signaling